MKKNSTHAGKQQDPDSSFKKKFTRIWCITASALLTLFVLWTLLDAFVIPSDIIPTDLLAEGAPKQLKRDDGDPAGQSAANAEEEDAASPVFEEEEEPEEILTGPVITDHSYKDGDIAIDISEMRMLDTNVYIAEITINDPSYIKTGLAEDSFGRNLTETTSAIASRNGAILAINGDYYGFRASGYVMRNGYLYRSTPARDPEQEDLVLYEDGSMEIVREADVTAEDIWESDAADIFSFGPGLVIDGEISVRSGDEVERAQVTNPRTAIGIASPLHYYFVVSDGRTDESVGLSLLELAQLMQHLGCHTAYNLDGGGSSTLWFNGKVLNRPTTFGDKIIERSISDIVYIGK